MSRRLLVGADGARNQWLTLVLVLVLLAPVSASAFDGSISLELSGGNRTLSANLIGDWGIVPDKLYLVGTYGVVRQAPDPTYASQASHVFGLGLDLMPTSHLMTSLSLSFSPKATDTLKFSDNLLVSSTRRNATALLALSYQSNGLGDFEWGLDASGMGAWYELATHAQVVNTMLDKTTSIFVVKPAGGVTFTLFGQTDLGLRGTYVWYSQDPTTAGGADSRFLMNLEQRFPVAYGLLSRTELVQAANQTASFAAAPPWFDVRLSVLHRFGSRVTGRLGYTFMRYVHGIGNAHQVNTRWTFKVSGWARLWAGVSIQYDHLRDDPSFLSGYGTLGAELATE